MILRRREKLFEEVALYQKAISQGDRDLSVHHLGRAHILSQSSVRYHLFIHYLMLGYAFKRVDLAEIAGQFLRLLVTVPGHLIGRVPLGNTGWSNIGLTQRLVVPEDLKEYL